MHYLIEKLMRKRGIEDVNELTKEEKIEFDKWELILTEREIKLEDLQKFLKEQKVLLWQKLDEEFQKDNESKGKCLYLRARIKNYESLLGLINSPRAEKESLENYLKQLIK